MKMTTEQARNAAAELRRFVNQVEAIMDTLDTGSTPCSCCGVIKHHNWAQSQLWSKLEGLAERTESVASIFARRADDPEFLGEENDANTGHQR